MTTVQNKDGHIFDGAMIGLGLLLTSSKIITNPKAPETLKINCLMNEMMVPENIKSK